MTLIERDWGHVVCRASKYKFEFLPRLTMSAVTDLLEINFGFLWFQLWVGIWSDRMREFNRRSHDTE